MNGRPSYEMTSGSVRRPSLAAITFARARHRRRSDRSGVRGTSTMIVSSRSCTRGSDEVSTWPSLSSGREGCQSGMRRRSRRRRTEPTTALSPTHLPNKLGGTTAETHRRSGAHVGDRPSRREPACGSAQLESVRVPLGRRVRRLDVVASRSCPAQALGRGFVPAQAPAGIGLLLPQESQCCKDLLNRGSSGKCPASRGPGRAPGPLYFSPHHDRCSSSAHRLLHERGDLLLVGGRQLLQRP
jgi:hypothetical protein